MMRTPTNVLDQMLILEEEKKAKTNTKYFLSRNYNQ